MNCPHCYQTIRYKERSGTICPKCGGEFVFEPRENSLKLTDKRFRNVADKLSENGKYAFTNGQMVHFLSRKRIHNSFSFQRGVMLAVSIVTVVAVALLSQSLFLPAIFAVIFVCVLAFFWRTEGDLTLPDANLNLLDSLGKWKRIYKKEVRLIARKLPPLSAHDLKTLRGVLVCPEKEILSCLSVNGVADELDLILINSGGSRSENDETKLIYVTNQTDLPVFVLHDASVDGCFHKDEFAQKYFKGDKRRRFYDIGLRPKMTMNTKLLRLRLKPVTDAYKNLQWLEPDEVAWLAKGNYTPLLALTPAQLIKFVTSAVERRYKQIGQTSEIKEAQSFGFMTWVGQ